MRPAPSRNSTCHAREALFCRDSVVSEPLLGSLAGGVECDTNDCPRVARRTGCLDRVAQLLFRGAEILTSGDDAAEVRRIIAGRQDLGTAEQELRDAVKAARAAGDSWTVIGVALDTSRQAAQQRFGND